MSDQIETRRRSLGRSMHDLYTISFFPNLVNICVISREIQSGNTVHAASIYMYIYIAVGLHAMGKFIVLISHGIINYCMGLLECDWQ